MTAKEFVKEILPKARAEKHKTNADKVYWLIRPTIFAMYMSTGKTESEAWKNAKEQLEKDIDKIIDKYESY